jgi:hypothetical protein
MNRKAELSGDICTADLGLCLEFPLSQSKNDAPDLVSPAYFRTTPLNLSQTKRRLSLQSPEMDKSPKKHPRSGRAEIQGTERI